MWLAAVTNDSAIAALNKVQVVPLTRSIERVFRGEALVTFQGAGSKALATQIDTLDKSRLGLRMGGLASEDMRRIEDAIKEQLGLS